MKTTMKTGATTTHLAQLRELEDRYPDDYRAINMFVLGYVSGHVSDEVWHAALAAAEASIQPTDGAQLSRGGMRDGSGRG